MTSEFLAGHAVTFAASVAKARARLVDGVFDVLLVEVSCHEIVGLLATLPKA